MPAPYVDSSLLTSICEPIESADAVILAQMATDILYGLTGRWIEGQATHVVRPVRRHNSFYSDQVIGFWGYPPHGVRHPWDPYVERSIHLGYQTIGTPTVTVDGANFTAFAMYPGNNIVRTDGSNWYPSQDPFLSSTQPNTLAITFPVGDPVSGLIQAATLELAAELFRQDIQRGFGSNVTSASSQGVGLGFNEHDPQVTSLPKVQAAVQTYNPLGQHMPPQVSDFDAPWLLVYSS